MQFILSERRLVGLTRGGWKALAFAAPAALGACLLVSMAGLLAPATLRAQTIIYWDTNGATAGASSGTTAAGTWDQSTTANWSTSSVGTNTTTTWSTAIGAGNAIADFSAGTNATGPFTVTVSGTVTGVGGITFEEGAVTLGGTGTLTLTNTGTINVAATTGTISAILGGTVGLTKTGTGTLVISSSNTYTGATNINAGTLRLGASNLIPNATAVTVASGATLDLNGFADTVGSIAGAGGITLGASGSSLQMGGANTSTTFSGVISGSGFVQKIGSGTLTLSGANTYTGATNINVGTVRLGAANAISSSSAVTVASGATFNLNNNSDTIGSLAGAGSVTLGTATLTAGANGTSTTFSGVISGTGNLTKTGAGNLTLSGANTYGGATTISGGILNISADSNLGTVPGVVTANELTLDDGTLQTTANMTLNANRGVTLGAGGGTLDVNSGTTLTYGGVIAGTGSLTKADSGTLVLSGANTYTGATNINAGILQLGASSVVPNTAVTVASGATFDLNSKSDTVGSIAGAGNVTLGTGTLTTGADNTSTNFSGVISGSGILTKTGTGTLTLSGVNTYTGATNINAGKLQLGVNNALSKSTAVTVASGATLNLNNYSDTIGSLAGSGVITLGSGTLTAGVSNASTTFSGSFTSGDTGTFAKTGTGTLTLGAAMNFSAGTLVLSGGTLNLGGYSSTFGSLNVTANSILDFGASRSSILNILNNVTITTGVTLTIQNWTDAVDFFYSENNPGNTILGQIVFNPPTYTGADTKWIPYGSTGQITPVPEPATYGAVLMLLGLSAAAWLRRRPLRGRD